MDLTVDSKCSDMTLSLVAMSGILGTCSYSIVRAGGGLSRNKARVVQMLAVVGQAQHLEDGPGKAPLNRCHVPSVTETLRSQGQEIFS